MLVFIIHWLIEYWGTISRYPRFQLVLANSELKEVYVMPFRENKEACLLSDRFWGGRGWSSVSAASPSCQVGPVGFFTLFSTLPLINTVMPSCIKVRDYFTELHQRITRGLKLVPWPWSIWTVYISWQPTDLSNNLSLLLSWMLWRNTEKISRKVGTFCLPCGMVRAMLKEKTNSHHIFINKGFFKN